VTLKRNGPGVNRPYRSPRRAAQAQDTRRAILDAAHELFLADGYAATSIRAVAQAAGVSDQTVYAHFGDKPSLLAGVGLRVVSGALAPNAEQAGDLASQLAAASDQQERIKIVAAFSRMVWEQGMLRFEAMQLDAAAGDPRAAQLAQELQQRKYDQNKQLFGLIFPPGSLPHGDDFDEAYDVLFALDSAAFIRILIDDRGWSWDTYQRWLVAILTRLFTPPPS
jgi:AcrR family transcriptional regulator